MSSSLTSGVPSGMPRSAATRTPTGPLDDDLGPAWLGAPQRGHQSPDPSVWLGPSSAAPGPYRGEVGPGPCPTAIGTTPFLAGVPGPPALFPTYLSQVRRGEGLVKLGSHPRLLHFPFYTFRHQLPNRSLYVSLGPQALFGGGDLPSFLTQGIWGGVFPPANAIIPSPSTTPTPERSPLPVESVTSTFEMSLL